LDREGLGAAGLYAKTETTKLIVPMNAVLAFGFDRVDRALGEFHRLPPGKQRVSNKMGLPGIAVKCESVISVKDLMA
jgi:hypothetical protein